MFAAARQLPSLRLKNALYLTEKSENQAQEVFGAKNLNILFQDAFQMGQFLPETYV